MHNVYTMCAHPRRLCIVGWGYVCIIMGDPVLLGGVVCIVVGCCFGSPTCLGVFTPFMCCWEMLWLSDVGELLGGMC